MTLEEYARFTPNVKLLFIFVKTILCPVWMPKGSVVEKVMGDNWQYGVKCSIHADSNPPCTEKQCDQCKQRELI